MQKMVVGASNSYVNEALEWEERMKLTNVFYLWTISYEAALCFKAKYINQLVFHS